MIGTLEELQAYSYTLDPSVKPTREEFEKGFFEWKQKRDRKGIIEEQIINSKPVSPPEETNNIVSSAKGVIAKKDFKVYIGFAVLIIVVYLLRKKFA